MEINQKAQINKRKYVKKCKQMETGTTATTATTAVGWIYYYGERKKKGKKRNRKFIGKKQKQ